MAPRLLFIHDHRENIESFLNPLDHWGFEVIVETTCADRYQQISNTNIDGILLDLEAVQLHGLSMLADLRREPIQIPTIVIGSSGTEHLLIAALTKGAQDYLLKPISIDALYEKCLRLFA